MSGLEVLVLSGFLLLIAFLINCFQTWLAFKEDFDNRSTDFLNYRKDEEDDTL